MSVGAVNKDTGARIPTAGMPAIDDALDLTSVNPVQNDIITAALANKQDKTDNNLQTTDKTIPGAINELKSGLTNVDNATILNTQDLTTPSRSKNIWAISIDKLKEDNTSGTWNGNTYSVSGISYVCTVDNGYVNAIENSGNTSGYPSLNVYIGKLKAGNYKISMEDRFRLYEDGVQIYDSYGQADYAFTANGTSTYNVTLYRGTGEIPSNTYHPMVRLATETDSTFAPYIPSVESRIEGLENNITTYTLTAGTNVSIDRGSCVKIGNLVIVDVLFTVSEPIAISTVLIGGLPTIGTSNISIVCYENNYSAFNEKAARIYGYEVFSGESFAAGKYRISTTYTIVN